MMMALACVGFVASKNVFLSIIAIIFGLAVGMVGETVTSKPRLTFGWEYLQNGIGMVVLLSGLFGVPELLDGFRRKLKSAAPPMDGNYFDGLREGFGDCKKNWRDMARGGLIGFVTGLLPGVGGAVGDFLAYGATKAAHKGKNQEVPFGEGNPVGLLGCEGANNAQKVSSMIPACLFGIPAAPFAAMVMAICMYFGMEIGTPDLLQDLNFTNSLAFGYIFGTIGVALLSIFCYKYILKVLEVPFWIYAAFILAVIVYANMQYTGGWEDLALLTILSAIGCVCKYFNISRPAILVAYVVAFKIDQYFWGTLQLYGYKQWKAGYAAWADIRWLDLFNIYNHPIFVICIVIAVGIFINSVIRKDKGIDYT